jgi:hypothetical protein
MGRVCVIPAVQVVRFRARSRRSRERPFGRKFLEAGPQVPRPEYLQRALIGHLPMCLVTRLKLLRVGLQGRLRRLGYAW